MAKKYEKNAWKIFYNRKTGEEYLSYTLFGEFEGEERATIDEIAHEKGINPADIKTRIETRTAQTEPAEPTTKTQKKHEARARKLVAGMRRPGKESPEYWALFEGRLAYHLGHWLALHGTPDAPGMKRGARL